MRSDFKLTRTVKKKKALADSARGAGASERGAAAALLLCVCGRLVARCYLAHKSIAGELQRAPGA